METHPGQLAVFGSERFHKLGLLGFGRLTDGLAEVLQNSFESESLHSDDGVGGGGKFSRGRGGGGGGAPLAGSRTADFLLLIEMSKGE